MDTKMKEDEEKKNQNTRNKKTSKRKVNIRTFRYIVG